MLRLAAFIALVVSLALSGFASVISAQAQGIQATASVENSFPQGLLFHLVASSDAMITDVRLRYQIRPEGALTSVVPEFESSANIDITFTLEGNNPPRLYLPPGTAVDYFWEIEDAAGNAFSTERATVVYDDIRFPWRLLTAGVINLHWYQGSEDFAQEMLEVAQRTIEDMSALLGAQVEFPIHVWAYANPSDMQAALIQESESYERRIITAGARVSKDTVLILNSGAALDTLRHELAHVVNAVAGEGPFGSLPAWLDEGTAVLAQEEDPFGYHVALERAVASGDVLSVPSISSPPGDPNNVILFYGQSWSLVSYLIDTYGPEKFAQLFATFKAGATTDDALSEVYGFNQRGLEDGWRQSLGLPPLERPEGGPTESPAGTGGPAQSNDDGSSGLLVGLIAGLVALAAVVGIGGYLLSRRLS